jgi:hypothetical protein
MLESQYAKAQKDKEVSRLNDRLDYRAIRADTEERLRRLFENEEDSITSWSLTDQNCVSSLTAYKEHTCYLDGSAAALFAFMYEDIKKINSVMAVGLCTEYLISNIPELIAMRESRDGPGDGLVRLGAILINSMTSFGHLADGHYPPDVIEDVLRATDKRLFKLNLVGHKSINSTEPNLDKMIANLEAALSSGMSC